MTRSLRVPAVSRTSAPLAVAISTERTKDRAIQQGDCIMMLGLSLHAVTVLHVVISLVAIVSGLIVLFGLFKSESMPGMTAFFLITTILTNATGFMFPFEKLLPSHIIAILSLVLLAIACYALYSMKLAAVWRPISRN